jgi:hypothetical protein
MMRIINASAFNILRYLYFFPHSHVMAENNRPQLDRTVQFRSRRRKKQKVEQLSVAEDDTALRLQQRQDVRSPPLLLALRESGKWRTAKNGWKTRMTKQADGFWRTYIRRRSLSIPFSKLDSPRTEAVLALDPTGSFMLSLGSGERISEPKLFLRCYGKHCGYMQCICMPCRA